MSQRPAHIPEDDWAEVQQQLGRITNNSGGIPMEKLINAGPNDLGNDAQMEMMWAEKAFKHAETYFRILQAMPDKKKIKLTQLDDEIYEHFRREFPASTFPLTPLNENSLKSAESKAAWRPFCESYDKNAKIVDFNMGTLLRLDANKDYEPDNTTIVPRIQFFAIEIARNREGVNANIKK